MNRTYAWRRLNYPALTLALLAVGCGQSEPTVNVLVDPAKLVSASGTVKSHGEPLAGAVVMLMNSSGIPSIGETGSDGRFVLETASQRGALPGTYQVTISYMVSPEGKPQGLASRSAMVRSKEMVEAVEVLPPEYSDIKKTKLTAEVGQEGARLDFDLPVTLELPRPKAESKDAQESQPADKDAEKAQPAEKDSDVTVPPKTPSTPAKSTARDDWEPGPRSSHTSIMASNRDRTSG
jgi:hypothetical protein